MAVYPGDGKPDGCSVLVDGWHQFSDIFVVGGIGQCAAGPGRTLLRLGDGCPGLPRHAHLRFRVGVRGFCVRVYPWYSLRWNTENRISQTVARLAIVVAALLVVAVSLRWPWQQMAIIFGICIAAGASSLVASISARKNQEQRLSAEEVRRLAANAERERIGRDLHDLLGHTLSLITLKLELSRKLFDNDSERARRELGEAEGVARHALAEVRAAVTGIRATGLAGELASARLLLRTSDVAFEVGDMPVLPDAVDDTLAMVLREAVTNIHRHARATHASVDVKVIDGYALMRVRDDGRGGVKASGNGLNGMRERVRTVGGSLRINSLPFKGTELDINIPMPSPDKPPLDIGEDEHASTRDNVLPLSHRAGGHS